MRGEQGIGGQQFFAGVEERPPEVGFNALIDGFATITAWLKVLLLKVLRPDLLALASFVFRRLLFTIAAILTLVAAIVLLVAVPIGLFIISECIVWELAGSGSRN
ncbi:hypothetical protein B0A49_02544 [Cryomyces minteri]|uniref:Uncharacterized protein n=1 Tax=Cryomyces minteri TaxID=331657 RepID=A0A4U0XZS3_9PEZI|nr:hypothetical protein B0A49_02544 [Cryomyces minteri]